MNFANMNDAELARLIAEASAEMARRVTGGKATAAKPAIPVEAIPGDD